MIETLRIDPRFCGPPDVGNGGYIGGRLSRHVDGPVEVSFRAPAPLDVPLVVEATDDGVVLRHGEQVLAIARGVEAPSPGPASPGFELARRLAGTCRALATHPFPRCFVCGPDRAAGDGLRILPGISGDLVLAPWEPDASLADDAGRIAPEFVWGALDCTSSFPLLEDEAAQALEPMVLGRLAVAQTGDLYAGKRAVVTAWSISVEGRRGVSGSAVFDDSGTQVAVARATWVSLAGR